MARVQSATGDGNYVRANGLDDEPQYLFKIDWEKASTLGLSVADITTTLSAAWGAQFVNDFVDRGRVKRVFIQGDAPSRMLPQTPAARRMAPTPRPKRTERSTKV